MKKRILASLKHKNSLIKADKMIYRVSKVGFQWPNLKEPLRKVEEELAELKYEIFKGKSRKKLEAELGDFIFTICNLCYFLKISPDRALHKMLQRFQRRFNYVETQVLNSKKPWRNYTLQELDVFWDKAKKLEKSSLRRKRK